MIVHNEVSDLYSGAIGVGLMLYPYAISQTWLLYAVGVALCVGLYVTRE